MISYRFFNQHNYRMSDTNMAHGGAYSTAVELRDAILSSKNGEELLNNLSKLKLVGYKNPSVDFESYSKVRISFDDGMGNTHYIEAVKDAVKGEEDMDDNRTVFYRIHVMDTKKWGDLQSLLLLNDYHVDYVDNNCVFVSEDEVIELTTILDDEGAAYEFV
jgi:hypothetical protein